MLGLGIAIHGRRTVSEWRNVPNYVSNEAPAKARTAEFEQMLNEIAQRRAEESVDPREWARKLAQDVADLND